jgi:hypothetical protein
MTSFAKFDFVVAQVYCETFGVKIISRHVIRQDMTKIEAKLKPRDHCPRFHQVRHVAVHHVNAKGPLIARSLARKALGNEEFCLQIDAHSSFSRHWDDFLREEWKKIDNEFAILSNVPAPMSEKASYEPGGEKETEVPIACAVKFQENGFPVSSCRD